MYARVGLSLGLAALELAIHATSATALIWDFNYSFPGDISESENGQPTSPISVSSSGTLTTNDTTNSDGLYTTINISEITTATDSSGTTTRSISSSEPSGYYANNDNLLFANKPGQAHLNFYAQSVTPSGEVVVRDNRLLRDGHEWIPHGFLQVAFVAAPGVKDSNPVFGIASKNYSPEEYAAMRSTGADSVRMQVSQPGLDPENPLFSKQFLDRVIAAVRAARAAGLTVIVSIQDESQSGETTPAVLPNNATRRVWHELAPVFGQDRGVLFELLNEPRLPVSPKNWQAWARSMNRTIRIVRESGAINVVVADGLQYAERLADAPLLNDPLGQVAYASHPYSHHASDQSVQAWDRKFGDFARKVPVIVTEWTTAVPYYCQTSTTPKSVVSFLQYLQDHKIGLEAVTWDWSTAYFGSAIYDFPHRTFSHFIGASGALSCGDAGFGPGAMIEIWYRTGVPPSLVQ